jgi:hypothetical protein
MNLLEGLDTRRGSAPPNMGTEEHYDSLMDLSDQSDDSDDLLQPFYSENPAFPNMRTSKRRPFKFCLAHRRSSPLPMARRRPLEL